MSDADKHAHICELRDAFKELRENLVALWVALGDKAKHRACPEEEHGTLDDGTRITFGFCHTPASDAWNAGRVRDAFEACWPAENAANELVQKAMPWLPDLAVSRGEGDLKFWTGDVWRCLHWTFDRRPDRVEEAEAYKHLVEVGGYWGSLNRLCIFTGLDPVAIPEANDTPVGSSRRPSTPPEQLPPAPALTCLSPDQFDFGNGCVLGGFTPTDLILLPEMARSGPAGIKIDGLREAVRKARNRGKGLPTSRCVQQQISRLRDSLGKAVKKLPGFHAAIDCVNGVYVLTAGVSAAPTPHPRTTHESVG